MVKQIHETDIEKFVDCHPPSQRDRVELSALAPFQRILLTTDGTLTKILEAYLLEEIQMVKLSERSLTTNREIPELGIGRESQVLCRKIWTYRLSCNDCPVMMITEKFPANCFV